MEQIGRFIDRLRQVKEKHEAGKSGELDQPVIPYVPVFRLLLILSAVLLWRAMSCSWVNLIPDECSYWTWSQYLDWSYFDNSPMVAYLIRLSTTLWGESTPFSVRFPFLILSFAGTWLVYRTSVLLFHSRRRAILACVAMNVTPLGVLGGAAAVHDNALTFFWIVALWACAGWVRSQRESLFYLMGVAAGSAILSKYTGVLLLPAILLFLLWNGEYRGRLVSRGPWIGALIALLFTLPILWWNYRHDWASFYHILFIGKGSSSYVQRLTDGLGYHLGQFGLVSPLIYGAMLLGLIYVAARNLARPRVEETLLLCFSFPLPAFGIMAFLGHVEANWAAMGYPSAMILVSEVIFAPRERQPKPKIAETTAVSDTPEVETPYSTRIDFSPDSQRTEGTLVSSSPGKTNAPDFPDRSSQPKERLNGGIAAGHHRLLERFFGRRFMFWSGAVALGMSALVVLHARLGLLPASVEARLGKADRVIWETTGWKELGTQVGGIQRKGEVIAGDSYQMTALLWFNVPGQLPVRYLAPWKRPTQFDVMEPSFDNLRGRDILFVSSTRLEPSSSARTTVFENFRKVTELRPFEVMYHGTSIRKIFLYRCEGFDPDSPRKLGPRSLLYRDY